MNTLTLLVICFYVGALAFFCFLAGMLHERDRRRTQPNIHRVTKQEVDVAKLIDLHVVPLKQYEKQEMH